MIVDAKPYGLADAAEDNLMDPELVKYNAYGEGVQTPNLSQVAARLLRRDQLSI